MANLKDIKAKISSVKGTQKTTKAMKLVSTAKLRRAEVVLNKSKEYARKIEEVMDSISQRVLLMKGSINNRAFDKIEVKKVDLILITADKGLCGGFNIHSIKKAKSLIDEYKEKNIKVRLRIIGRKGIEYFKFNDYEILDSKIGLSAAPNYDEAVEFISKSYEDFYNETIDGIIIIHNGYVNKLVQEVRVNNLLPLEPHPEQAQDILEIEPQDDEEVILEQSIKKYVEYTLYYALLDSLAAEHSARMQAMDAATNNAGEMVKELTLQYNKARQEAVTTELIEIISGMEALN